MIGFMPKLRNNVALAVDLVVLTIRDGRLAALLVERGLEPFAGSWALPGGFVLPGEELAEAAGRELAEEAGVAQVAGHLEQLGTYGDPQRDPRGRVVSVAHLALVPDLPIPSAGSDASDARWQPVDDIETGRLAFDHASILAAGVERARAKLEYTPLAAAFCPAEFTVAELRLVYEAVWGVQLDARNFHRKITGTAGFVEAIGETTVRNGGRPAQLFTRGNADLLHPAMLRPAAK